MRKILVGVLAVLLVFCSLNVFAAKSSSEITSEIKTLHSKIIESNGGNNLDGWCAQYVSWSLYHAGITSKFEARGNGKDVYDNWRNISTTSGGYSVKAYPGSNCLNDIINANGNEVYNVLVGFDYSPYGDEGKKYGHVMFIYAIVDGKIYYSESGTWNGKATGHVFSLTLDQYKAMYNGHIYDGAIHFTKGETSNSNNNSSNSNIQIPENSWSEWTTEKLPASNDIEVRSKIQYGYYHYILWWSNEIVGSYPINANVMDAQYDIDKPTKEVYHEYWSDTELSVITTSKLQYLVGGSKVIYDKYPNNCCTLSGASRISSINHLYFLGSRTVYSYKKTHTHSYSTEYESAHPHKQYKYCSCGEKEYTGNTRTVDGCDGCHTHSYSTEYESAHPHRQYKYCSCGAKEYTGTTPLVRYCDYCFPPYDLVVSGIIDNKTEIYNLKDIATFDVYINDECIANDVYEYDEDHLQSEKYEIKDIKVKNGYKFISKKTMPYNGPSNIKGVDVYLFFETIQHEHNFEYKYESSHPHQEYKYCSCGEKEYTGNTKNVDSCEECNPITRVTLFYNANGGTEAPSPKTVKSGESVKVSDEKLSRSGYEFLGWSKNEGAVTPEYYGNEKITLTGDLTLYAVWSKKDDAASQIRLTIGSTKASVFGETAYNDVSPVIENSRTMLPARFVAENLGAAVSWNDDTKTVTISKDSINIQIIIGSEYAYVNGEAVYLDSPAFIRNSRTYTPVRFICESLGAKVEWNEAAQQVVITK